MDETLEAGELDAQLQSELRSSIAQSLASHRPILTHLNADTTWLLSIPIPQEENQSGRNYYHVLIDPWLKGPQADVTRFLSQQWHTESSAVQSIEGVAAVVEELEQLALEREDGSGNGGLDAPLGRRRKGKTDVEVPEEERTTNHSGSAIDLVVVSHEFTDHMHKDTLLEISPEIPVFATSVAAARINSWGHFKTCIDMPKFHGSNQDYRSTSRAPLPTWLTIARLDSSSSDLLNYHSAVLLAFSGEAIIYTPHGITPSQLIPISSSAPRLSTLALIHTMHDIRLSGAQLNLGAHNGLKAQRLIQARYWVGTHDEVKTGAGLVSWILRRKVVSLEEALKEEVEKAEDVPDVCFVDLKNGQSFILE